MHFVAAHRPPHEHLAPPESVGLDGERLRAAARLFRQQQRRGLFPGGQIAVRRYGRLVLNECVGIARGWRATEEHLPTPVTPTTRFPAYSSGKPLVALAVALLEERGMLDVRMPIARVFPEFAQNGKAAITCLDVLTHRAGLLLPDVVRRHQDWRDWDRVVAAIARSRPTYPRGTLAYQPFEYGWVLAEVVRRVAGRRLDEIVADEITGPAGLHALRFGATVAEHPHIARSYWLGRGPVALVAAGSQTEIEEISDSRDFFGAFVPGAGLVADAASLAHLYDILLAGGVTSTGRRVIAQHTLARYTARHAFGWDRTTRFPLAVGRGFLLGTPFLPSVYGWFSTETCFGHAGAYSSVAFGDRASGLAVAVVTNGNRDARDVVRRFIPLGHALRRAVVKP